MNFPYQISRDDKLCRKIHRVFARSEYGKKLRDQVRFGPYKPQDLPNKEWEKILGRDVNNLYHMPFTAYMTRRFVNKCRAPGKNWGKNISPHVTFYLEEEKSLVFAAQVHDWGEAVIGDIPAPFKTNADEEKELEILKKMVIDLLSRRDKSLSLRVKKSVEEVMEDRSSKLGMAFDAVERMGYVKVGLRAWRMKDSFSGELKERLFNLATWEIAPVKREGEKLRKYAEIYPPVYEFMNDPYNVSSIKQILKA